MKRKVLQVKPGGARGLYTVMQNGITDKLSQLGFKRDYGGVHAARTIMLEELLRLLEYVPNPDAPRQEYARAIVEDNCLGKRSVKNRILTKEYLFSLYALDPAVPLFRVLRYFWSRDPGSRPLIAFLCAVARDRLLQLTVPFLFRHEQGDTVNREKLEAFIAELNPNRYSRATLKSIAQNIASTWTKSGHLLGKAQKVRGRANPGPGAAAYALFLATLSGARGQMLFETDTLKLLDIPAEHALELAELAARRGWMICNRIGEVIEVSFPGLLTPPAKEQTE